VRSRDFSRGARGSQANDGRTTKSRQARARVRSETLMAATLLWWGAPIPHFLKKERGRGEKRRRRRGREEEEKGGGGQRALSSIIKICMVCIHQFVPILLLLRAKRATVFDLHRSPPTDNSLSLYVPNNTSKNEPFLVSPYCRSGIFIAHTRVPSPDTCHILSSAGVGADPMPRSDVD
jgi:hypothetical protein